MRFTFGDLNEDVLVRTHDFNDGTIFRMYLIDVMTFFDLEFGIKGVVPNSQLFPCHVMVALGGVQTDPVAHFDGAPLPLLTYTPVFTVIGTKPPIRSGIYFVIKSPVLAFDDLLLPADELAFGAPIDAREAAF